MMTKDITGTVGVPLDPLEITDLRDEHGEPLFSEVVEFSLEKGSGQFTYADDRTDTQGGCIAEFVPDKPGRMRIECRVGPFDQQQLIAVFRLNIEGRREEDPKPKKRRKRSAPKQKDKEVLVTAALPTAPQEQPLPTEAPVAPVTPAPDPVAPPQEETRTEAPSPTPTPVPVVKPTPAPTPPVTKPSQTTVRVPRKKRRHGSRSKVPFGLKGFTMALLLFVALLLLVILATAIASSRGSGDSSATTPTQSETSAPTVDCLHPTRVHFLPDHKMVLEGCTPSTR